MVWRKKFIGMKTAFYTYQSHLHCIGCLKIKYPEKLGDCHTSHGLVRNDSLIVSEIGNLRRLQLKLQFVSDQGDELTISGFSLGIADGIAEETLEGIQIAPVPGYFDGMADGTFHPAGGGLECLGHLRIQYLCNSVGVPYGPPGSLAGCSRRTLQRLSANVDDLLLSLSSRNSLL